MCICPYAYFTSPKSACRHIVDETVKKWGRIDILVNNAALQDKKVDKFEEIGRERLERTFHTNILAYFTIAQHAVKHMKKGSAIINVASVQAYQPEPGILDYACTKVSVAARGSAVSHIHQQSANYPGGLIASPIMGCQDISLCAFALVNCRSARKVYIKTAAEQRMVFEHMGHDELLRHLFVLCREP